MLWRSITILLMSAFLVGANADIYRTVSPDGSVVFTDKNVNGDAEKVKLKPVSVSKPATEVTLTPQDLQLPAKTTSSADGYYTSVKIMTPQDGDTLWNQPKTPVVVGVTPPLQPGDKVQLKMDGKVVRTNTTGSFELDYVERGIHTFEAQVLNAQGKVLRYSKTIKVYVQRTGLNNRAGKLNVTFIRPSGSYSLANLASLIAGVIK
ncbi:MAG: hypothetical protein P1U34_08850 [Coxiellaceae bacterium]|nr:hypothetical protein [Coxiellaceae bacterium]